MLFPCLFVILYGFVLLLFSPLSVGFPKSEIGLPKFLFCFAYAGSHSLSSFLSIVLRAILFFLFAESFRSLLPRIALVSNGFRVTQVAKPMLSLRASISVCAI